MRSKGKQKGIDLMSDWSPVPFFYVFYIDSIGIVTQQGKTPNRQVFSWLLDYKRVWWNWLFFCLSASFSSLLLSVCVIDLLDLFSRSGLCPWTRGVTTFFFSFMQLEKQK